LLLAGGTALEEFALEELANRALDEAVGEGTG